ncbi:hypothetical protein [Parafrankia elaeagni]|uniref:hypothetical protein n=1 Tax=Parafrankia elaeagni TaxID=222534 RepID=UPI00037B78A8|nr:hypothetical protein [Parafrankia elaeagni]
MLTDSSRSPQAAAPTLLIDQGDRFLFPRTSAGARTLPVAALTFDVPPFRPLVGLTHRRPGPRSRARDLIVHVPTPSNQRDRSGNTLIVRAESWTGDPTPDPALNTFPARRWRPPRQLFRPLAAGDGWVTPAWTTTSLDAHVGGALPGGRTA